jgi:hypothetical protein
MQECIGIAVVSGTTTKRKVLLNAGLRIYDSVGSQILIYQHLPCLHLAYGSVASLSRDLIIPNVGCQRGSAKGEGMFWCEESVVCMHCT